ncbi:SDR family oxidoreductase [Mycolicibacterium neoaurum]|uniref:SDR family NAD(P)-dependent oxidoreductase n=1 Tax=Mycolicibacterium neoaurum TaxID=1795 RepID=UPI001BCBF667|nr:SDR family oxidoreductase [Mycolicibacterium neoaurum]QVI27338.1 SDR family oxidoreductase [Mycolicibacterium neoaurum]
MMSSLDLFDLTGRVAVVTGAAGGLGSSFSRTLARAGARVVCADFDSEKADRVADNLVASGFIATAVGVDVTDESSVAALVDIAFTEYGQVDILVNNAGIGDIRAVPMHRVRVEHWRSVIDVDLNGVFLCSRAVLGHMAERKSGKVINIASMYGLQGAVVTPMPAYTAAKGAVVNLTRECALQYAAYNVQVNALCPGYVRTGLAGGVYSDPAFVSKLTAQVPMGRIAEAHELDGAILMLASAASDYMTGQTLVLDGGVSAG